MWLQQLGGVQLIVRTCNGYSTWNTRTMGCVKTPYVRWLQQMERLCRDAVRAMVTADGTHAPWLRRDVHAWRNPEHALSLLYTVP